MTDFWPSRCARRPASAPRPHPGTEPGLLGTGHGDRRIADYVLDRLVEASNAVVVIELNFDVIKNVDWVIDLRPEGGDRGGEIVAEGPPKEIAKSKRAYTGQVLKEAGV